MTRKITNGLDQFSMIKILLPEIQQLPQKNKPTKTSPAGGGAVIL
jgi:hypothetical protein